MRNLITCPTCEERGVKQNLAEMLPSGYVSIQRFTQRKSGDEYTIVGGNEFYLKCGKCGNNIYVRESYVGTSIT